MSEKEAFVKRCPALGKAALINLLKDRFGEEKPAYYIVRRVEEIKFDYFKPPLAGWVVVNWPEGRVFSSEMEVRWRKVTEEGHDVLALAEQDISLPGLDFVSGPWKAVEGQEAKQGIYLWGSTRLGDEERGYFWVETRIPRRLKYPSQGKTVRLGHWRYQTDGGVVQFIRLAEVT